MNKFLAALEQSYWSKPQKEIKKTFLILLVF